MEMSTVDAAIIDFVVNGGSSGGASTTDEITLVDQFYYQRFYDESHNDINFTNISVAMTGTIVKLYNTTTSKLESYVMVRMTPDSELDTDTSGYVTNAHFISLDNDKIFEACVQTYGSGPNYCIHILVPINTYADSWKSSPTPETVETGIYRTDKMGSTTLAKIVTNLPQLVGSSGITYSAGDAINITDNTINVKYNTSTMELVNGTLSAKTNSSGGEDVGVKLEGTYVQSSSINKLYIKNIPAESCLNTGMLLNLKHLASGAIHKFVLVRFRYTNADKPEDAKDDENIFIPLIDGVSSLPAKIYSDDGDTYTIEIDGVADGTYSSLDSASQFMIPIQLSSKTLVTILRNQYEYFRRLNDLLIYLEDMVEKLKQKAGL